MSIPIIIIGAGRSGTKFLRDLISQGNNCEKIPYDIGYIWKYGNESIKCDELLIGHVNKKIKNHIRKSIYYYVRKRGTKYIIEKSVPNALRTDFVYNVFPEAKYINIVRDGRDVVESSFRVWNQPHKISYYIKKLRYFPINNIGYINWYLRNVVIGVKSSNRVWGPLYNGIFEDLKSLPLFEVCAKQWDRCIQKSLFGLANIDEPNKLSIKYEHLVHNPDTVGIISNFLGFSNISYLKLKNYHNTMVLKNRSGLWKKSFTNDQNSIILSHIKQSLSDLSYI